MQASKEADIDAVQVHANGVLRVGIVGQRDALQREDALAKAVGDSKFDSVHLSRKVV